LTVYHYTLSLVPITENCRYDITFGVGKKIGKRVRLELNLAPNSNAKKANKALLPLLQAAREKRNVMKKSTM
jgi:hypothetical protein